MQFGSVGAHRPCRLVFLGTAKAFCCPALRLIPFNLAVQQALVCFLLTCPVAHISCLSSPAALAVNLPSGFTLLHADVLGKCWKYKNGCTCTEENALGEAASCF